MIERSKIVELARSYIDVRFEHQGRTRSGLDCLGLIAVVAQDAGFDYSFPQAYTANPTGQRIVEKAEDYVVKPRRQGWDQTLPGDIVCMWGSHVGIPQHFAIIGSMYGKKTMIHAFQRAGKVIEHNIIPFWAERYVATFCYPDTENLEG